jgi:hypothetical protein
MANCKRPVRQRLLPMPAWGAAGAEVWEAAAEVKEGEDKNILPF